MMESLPDLDFYGWLYYNEAWFVVSQTSVDHSYQIPGFELWLIIDHSAGASASITKSFHIISGQFILKAMKKIQKSIIKTMFWYPKKRYFFVCRNIMFSNAISFWFWKLKLKAELFVNVFFSAFVDLHLKKKKSTFIFISFLYKDDQHLPVNKMLV